MKSIHLFFKALWTHEQGYSLRQISNLLFGKLFFINELSDMFVTDGKKYATYQSRRINEQSGFLASHVATSGIDRV